ncbi:MAG: type II secretion system F family protein [Acidimicrobiia bacterium]
MIGVEWVVAACAAVSAGAAVSVLVPPPVRLRWRARPYLAYSRSLLGTPVDPATIDAAGVRRAMGRQMLLRLRGAGNRSLRRKLRGSGLWPHTDDETRVIRYRAGVLGATVVGGAAGVAVAALTTGSAGRVLALLLAGGVGGGSLWRGRVDRATRTRRERMRLELATVDQLLAMWVRAGGGIVTAAQRLVERGRGDVVDEIAEGLRLHLSGMSVEAAFHRVAKQTPEPHARRCYQLLAGAHIRGSDSAGALLALAEDVRAARRDGMRRVAARRRAAMLFPIVAVLGPVLILFVAAPLPWIVLRSIA